MTTPEPLDPRVVCVRWRDTSSLSAWDSRENAEKLTPVQCTSYGFIVAETSDTLTMADTHTLGDDRMDDVRHVHCIPRGCIESVITLVEEPATAEINRDRLPRVQKTHMWVP